MLALMAINGSPDHSVIHPFRESRPEMQGPKGPQAPSSEIIDVREDLFLDGDDATHVFEVLEGVICAYRLLPDGARHIISFYYPGDVLGFDSQKSYVYSAQALTRARVRRITRASLERDIERRPELAKRLLHMTTLQLAATRDHLLYVAVKSAQAKVAAFLVALSRRNASLGQNPATVDLPMTRLDIADYLGLTIETVSRTMSKFRHQGLISLPRATHVLIRDLTRLEALVEA
jgi:CRP/FNR family transcriptional regulator